VSINIPDEDINSLFSCLASKDIKYITQKPQTLEAYFKTQYSQDGGGVSHD
jgi:hypothetical protein